MGNETRFRTLVVDPPWRFRNARTGGSFTSGASQKYQTLTIEELSALDIDSIAARTAVLFLWVPVALLPDALRVMNAWRFKYKTAIAWHKLYRLGMGYWFRNSFELCLLGVKGNVKAFRCQKPNVIQSRPRSHSHKPEEFWKLIDPHAPQPRIELFARNRRAEWFATGLECNGKRVQEAIEHIVR